MKMKCNSGRRNYRKVAKFADGGMVPTPKEDPRGDYRKARRTLKDPLWKPVTVMEDIVGRFSESKGRSNAHVDAVRRGALETIKKSGYED